MLRSFVAVLAVLALSSCSSLSVKEPTYQRQTFTDIRASTVQVTTSEGGCSGVVISPIKVLTAAHCDGPELKVDGQPAVVVKKNDKADLMLLITITDKPAMDVAAARPEVDEVLALSGYPLGMGLVITQGRLQELLVAELPHHMLVSTPGVFGNSGGPCVVFNYETRRYEVVGIASMVAMVGWGAPVTHLLLVVNTETIREFLAP